MNLSAKKNSEKQSKNSAESEKEKHDLLIEVEASNFNDTHKKIVRRTIEINRLYKSKHWRIKLEERKSATETEEEFTAYKEVIIF